MIPRMSPASDLLTSHGIPRDGLVLVHSAFRTLSAKGWTPARLIEGLLAGLPSGTLAMPAMNWRAVSPAQPHFDERLTPTITGILSETFRANYATHRSLHPTHSAAAFGSLAQALTCDHHLDETPVGDRSAFAKIAAMNGHILLLGVEMDCCTLVHHGEEKVAPEIYLKPEIETYYGHRANGEVVPVRTRRHIRLARNFWQFEEELFERGESTRTAFDGVATIAFRAADLNQIVLARLGADPQGTIAKPGQRFKMM